MKNNSFPMASFKKFTDDTTILTTGKSLEEAADKTNTVLSKVNIWYKQNELNLNQSKTWYMTLKNRQRETYTHRQ